MHTTTHGLIRVKAGEPLVLIFSITDRTGVPIDLAGATAFYRLARRPGDPALLSVTDGDGITLAGSTATVEFSTSDLTGPAGPMLGDFTGQLRIVKDGDGLVVAEGPISIDPVII